MINEYLLVAALIWGATKRLTMKTFVCEVKVKQWLIRSSESVMKSDTMKPPNCSSHMLCRTEFLSPRHHVLFLAVGRMYKYPLPTLLMGLCSRTCKPARIRAWTVHRGGVAWRSRGRSGALNITGMLVCDGPGWGARSSEGSSALSLRPAGSWVHSCCPGTGWVCLWWQWAAQLSGPPPPRTGNRCIKGNQRRGKQGETTGRVWEGSFSGDEYLSLSLSLPLFFFPTTSSHSFLISSSDSPCTLPPTPPFPQLHLPPLFHQLLIN